MGVEEARRTFNRLLLSMFVIVLGILVLSLFPKVSQTSQAYTGQFYFMPTTFLIAFVIALFSIALVLLRSGIGKKP